MGTEGITNSSYRYFTCFIRLPAWINVLIFLGWYETVFSGIFILGNDHFRSNIYSTFNSVSFINLGNDFLLVIDGLHSYSLIHRWKDRDIRDHCNYSCFSHIYLVTLWWNLCISFHSCFCINNSLSIHVHELVNKP